MRRFVQFTDLVRRLERGENLTTRAIASDYRISQRTAERWLVTIDHGIFRLSAEKSRHPQFGHVVLSHRMRGAP